MDKDLDSELAFVPSAGDPQKFLLAVMNNAAIDMAHRIEAAAALMPYCHERLASEDDEEED